MCDENVKFKLKREPDFFKDKKGERIYWLTQDFLDHKGITKLHGKQFRYILPLDKKSRKYLKKSTVEWTLNYPKHDDLKWIKTTKDGKVELSKMPKINSDITEYNYKNVNNHKKHGVATLENFLQ